MHSTKTSRIPIAVTSRAPELALVMVTMIWGGTFLAVKLGLASSSPMFFVGCRFAAAALAVGLHSWRAIRCLTRQDLVAGMLIGISIAGGYGLQTIGLRDITSSESAFLTALYVPMVPLLQWVLFRQSPHLMCWVGIALAFIGLMLLAGGDASGITLNQGQTLTLLGSVAIAIEIILISRFAPKVDARRVTVVQLIVASVFAFASMPIAGETSIPSFSWVLVGLVVALGSASAAIQLTINWAQRSVDPSRAAIIYAGEPVWAGVFGRIAGERLPALALFAGALVVLGVLVSELRPRWRKPALPLSPAQ